MKLPPIKDRSELTKLLDEAIGRVAAMTPEEKESMYRLQRESWVRGEMGIGSDADEARYRENMK
jgi:hypothetical protein